MKTGRKENMTKSVSRIGEGWGREREIVLPAAILIWPFLPAEMFAGQWMYVIFLISEKAGEPCLRVCLFRDNGQGSR